MKGLAFLALPLLTVIACGGEDLAVRPAATPAPFPTYHGDVESILAANCVGCHTEGGIGEFPLDSPEAASEMAAKIVGAVGEGLMPPWPPGPDSRPMKDERRLSSDEKALLVAWARAGAPLGRPDGGAEDSSDGRETAEARPDLVMVMDPPYLPAPSRDDDYRCFLLDPQLDRETFVTGYQVRPGQDALVHHAILFDIGPDVVGHAEEQDQADPGPGWTCFGGPGIRGDYRSFRFLGFWVPGTSGTEFPDGTGKLLKAGSRVGLQVHYNLGDAGGLFPDATSVELFLAPQDAELEPIQEIPLLAPVEVRCPGPYPDDPSDPCHREYALEHSELRLFAQLMHLACDTRPEDYTGRGTLDVSDQVTSCDQSVHEDALALGVIGHMHLRGRWIKIELNPGTDGAETLLHIPNWDFEWQGQYWFQDPVRLGLGDTVRITCAYDNSGPIDGPDGDLLVPRYMTWGEGTTDEMCVGALNVASPGGVR